jgi:integrase
VNRHVAALRAVLNAGVRWRMIDRNPIAGLEQEHEGNRRTRWLSREEMSRLLDACRASRARQLAPLVILLLTTSKRLGAMLELRWEDVDLERRVAVFHATNTKTNQVEVACLNEDAVAALREVPRVSDWVWTRRDGARWRDPRPAFRMACRRAGLADVKGRFHVLRHTAATWMEMAGVPITTIARVTGHRSRAALERYLHDSDRAARAAVEALRLEIDEDGRARE